MAAPVLLVLIGSLIITQTIWGHGLERLGLKQALVGS